LIIEAVTKHGTPQRCIVHGVAIIKENDFLETMCEEITKEREIQWVFFLFCPMKNENVFFFRPYEHNREMSSSLPLQKKKKNVLRKFKLPHHPQPPNVCVYIKFYEGL
jgi:hypothetical protein